MPIILVRLLYEYDDIALLHNLCDIDILKVVFWIKERNTELYFQLETIFVPYFMPCTHPSIPLEMIIKWLALIAKFYFTLYPNLQPISLEQYPLPPPNLFSMQTLRIYVYEVIYPIA